MGKNCDWKYNLIQLNSSFINVESDNPEVRLILPFAHYVFYLMGASVCVCGYTQQKPSIHWDQIPLTQ